MRATLHGQIGKSSALVVGAWDPFIPAHKQLIEQLRSHTCENGLSSVVVMLEPSPSLFVWGRHDWPVFDDAKTRAELIWRCGVDAILLVHMTRADIDAGAVEFFELLQAHVTISELWLGVYQTLGTGLRGATAAVNELAEQRGIDLKRLPPLRLETEDVRKHLAAGRLRDASRVVGRSPVRRRPKALSIRLAWKPGPYHAVALDSPTAALDGHPLSVELVAQSKGLPILQWPDPAIRYLAFVAGPGDSLTP